MGLFDSFKKTTGASSGKSETFTFDNLPNTVEELKQLPEAACDTEFKVAALSVLALCRYGTDSTDALAMLDALKGPQPLSPYEKSFLRDRLSGKDYKPRSFLAGATPENGYTPQQPYTVTVSANPYSYDEEGYATLYLKSGGADSPRPVKLRKKPSTGQWFLWEIQYLSDIRVPAAEDPWA